MSSFFKLPDIKVRRAVLFRHCLFFWKKIYSCLHICMLNIFGRFCNVLIFYKLCYLFRLIMPSLLNSSFNVTQPHMFLINK